MTSTFPAWISERIPEWLRSRYPQHSVPADTPSAKTVSENPVPAGTTSAETPSTEKKANLPVELISDGAILLAKHDELGRGAFASQMAKALHDHRGAESLVVALRGGWGSGKTSLKNMVVEKLGDMDPKVTVLEFMPWRWSTEEQIATAFFRELAVTLGNVGQSDEARSASYKMLAYGELLGHAADATKSLNEHRPRLTDVLTWLAISGSAVGLSFKPPSDDRIATILAAIITGIVFLQKLIMFFWRDKTDKRPLEIIRSDLASKLNAMPNGILIVVDDIDRLSDDQIRLVLRYVKSNLNLPRLTFLLLYQRDVVEKAVSSYGTGYMDKIVQLAFDVPPASSSQISGYFEKGLKALMATVNGGMGAIGDRRFDELWLMGMSPFFANLRNAKRYLVSLGLHLRIHEGKRIFEANVLDVMAIETLRMFEPAVFEKLSKSKSMLVGHRVGPERKAVDEAKAKIAALLKDAVNEEATWGLARQIFPIIAWAKGGSFPNHERSGAAWLAARRVCSEEYFDRYFRLRLEDGEISESFFAEFTEAMADGPKLDAFLAATKGREVQLMYRLSLSFVEVPVQSIPILLPRLFDIAENYNRTGSGPSVFGWLRLTADGLLRRLGDRRVRGRNFMKVLEMMKGVSLASDFLDDDREAREKGETDKVTLADKDFEAAKRFLAKKIDAFSKYPKAFLESPNVLTTLLFWRHCALPGTIDKFMDRVWNDRELAMALIGVFIQEHIVAGEESASRVPYFDLATAALFIDPQILVGRVRRYPEDELTNKQRENVALLNQSVTRRSRQRRISEEEQALGNSQETDEAVALLRESDDVTETERRFP